ncbi:M1 family metallopeptidase [Streptomyces sp. NPDC002004]
MTYASAGLVLALAACAALSGGVRGTPGASGVHDPYFPRMGNGGYDVAHYALDLDYEPGNRHLTGTADITARSTQALSAFNLDLKGLTVRSVTVDGTPARFSRAGQELTIRPHDDIRKDRTFRTTVRYSGTPQTITDPDTSKEGWLPTEDGALGLGEPTGSMAWYPGNHHPSDKATYDITVTVPKGLEAVSNGELRRRKTQGGHTTFSWHEGRPMADYLATVAIGDFETKTYDTKGLHVFTAVDPDQSGTAQKVLGRLPEVMEWEQRVFGPYPFSSTGAIIDRKGDAGYALETQTRPVFPGTPSLHTFVHELSHEWYGDSVTPKSWQDMWLNEGFATYAEWLWDEQHGGDSAQKTFDDLYSGSDGSDGIWAFPPARPSSAAHISDSPVYERGAMVLHKVRQTMGDKAFFALLRSWPGDHRYGNADTADFTAYVEHAAGPARRGQLRKVWDDWLYGDGKPDHA